MTRVAIMNGGLGTITDAVSPVVTKVAQSLRLACDVFTEKGSYLRKTQRRFEEWVREHNAPNDTLVAIGKSTGAWNIMHVLNKLNDNPGICYAYAMAIFIDMNYASLNFFHKLNRNNQDFRIHAPNVNVINFYQKGAIGGMMCVSHPHSNIELQEVAGEPVTHFNIVNALIVQGAIEAAMRSAEKCDKQTHWFPQARKG